MRASIIGAAMIASALTAPVHAQSPLDGPLAAPGDTSATPPAPPHSKAKPKKMHHAAARPSAPHDAADAPTATPTAAPGREAPADPFSLGMKWNGNNDSAAQTRSQNLDGNAAGTGAEVGMKLHF